MPSDPTIKSDARSPTVSVPRPRGSLEPNSNMPDRLRSEHQRPHVCSATNGLKPRNELVPPPTTHGETTLQAGKRECVLNLARRLPVPLVALLVHDERQTTPPEHPDL